MSYISKWLKRLVMGAGALLLSYIALVYLLILLVSAFPQQLIYLANKVTSNNISYSAVETSMMATGVGVVFEDLSVSSPSFELEANYLSFDLEILLFALPYVALGDSLEADSIKLHRASVEKSASVSLSPQSISKILGSIWRQIDLEDLVVTTVQHPDYKVYVSQIDASRITSWNLLANFELLNSADEVLAGYSLSGRFELGALTRIKQGSLVLEQKNSARFKDLLRLFPDSLSQLEKLPDGQVKFVAEAKFSSHLLSSIEVDLDLDKLDWQIYKSLPSSLGVSFTWLNRDVNDRSLLAITNLKINHKEVEGFNPIQLVKQQEKLNFYTEGVDLEPLLGILTHSLDRRIDNIKSMRVDSFRGSLDIPSLKIEDLVVEISELSWAKDATKIKIPHLALEVENSILTLEANKKMEFHTDTTLQEFYSIELEPWRLHEKNGFWEIATAKFSLNSLPFELVGRGADNGFVDIKLFGWADSLDEVKNSFLPYKIMPDNVAQWLKDSLVQGSNIQAEAQVKGLVQNFPFLVTEGVFKAQARLDNAILDYDPDWPAVENFSALVEFQPFDLKITANKAEIYNAQAEDVEVKITNLAGENIDLIIKGMAETEAQNGLNFLLNSPLAEDLNLEDFLTHQVSAQGSYQVYLDEVKVPLSEQGELVVKGGVELAGSINLLDFVEATSLTGRLNFSHYGVSTPTHIAFDAFGSAQKLEIQTATKTNTININSLGAVNLKDEYGFTGTSDLSVKLKIPLNNDKEPFAIKVATSNSNLVSSWPSPLDNSFANQPLDFSLKMLGSKTLLDIAVPNKIDLQLDMEEDSDGLSINKLGVFLNNAPRQEVSNSLIIKGQLDEINIDLWKEAFNRFEEYLPNRKAEGATNLKLSSWLQSDLTIDKLVFLGVDYNQLRTSWITRNNKLELKINSDYIGAELKPNKQTERYDLNLSHLYIRSPSKAYSAKEKEKQKANQKTIKKQSEENCAHPSGIPLIPSIDFYMENVVLGKFLINQADFKYEDSDDAMTFSDINITVGQKKTQGLAWYQWNKSSNLSELTLNATSNDVASFTDFLTVKKGFSGNKANLITHLKWSGGPHCFGLTKLDGNIDLRLDDGHIDQVEPGLARLIGLLSIDSIVRRLKLDLKDITTKGLEYNRIIIKSAIDKEIINFSKVEMRSPGLRLGLKGEVNIVDYSLDMQAKVTPAMGGALTTIAAIAGLANPVTGILTYILAKTTPFINEDLLTYDYEITGNLEKPKIKSKGASVLFQ